MLPVKEKGFLTIVVSFGAKKKRDLQFSSRGREKRNPGTLTEKGVIA
jgi:hypothetical protein